MHAGRAQRRYSTHRRDVNRNSNTSINHINSNNGLWTESSESNSLGHNSSSAAVTPRNQDATPEPWNAKQQHKNMSWNDEQHVRGRGGGGLEKVAAFRDVSPALGYERDTMCERFPPLLAVDSGMSVSSSAPPQEYGVRELRAGGQYGGGTVFMNGAAVHRTSAPSYCEKRTRPASIGGGRPRHQQKEEEKEHMPPRLRGERDPRPMSATDAHAHEARKFSVPITHSAFAGENDNSEKGKRAAQPQKKRSKSDGNDGGQSRMPHAQNPPRNSYDSDRHAAAFPEPPAKQQQHQQQQSSARPSHDFAFPYPGPQPTPESGSGGPSRTTSSPSSSTPARKAVTVHDGNTTRIVQNGYIIAEYSAANPTTATNAEPSESASASTAAQQPKRNYRSSITSSSATSKSSGGISLPSYVGSELWRASATTERLFPVLAHVNDAGESEKNVEHATTQPQQRVVEVQQGRGAGSQVSYGSSSAPPTAEGTQVPQSPASSPTACVSSPRSQQQSTNPAAAPKTTTPQRTQLTKETRSESRGRKAKNLAPVPPKKTLPVERALFTHSDEASRKGSSAASSSNTPIVVSVVPTTATTSSSKLQAAAPPQPPQRTSTTTNQASTRPAEPVVSAPPLRTGQPTPELSKRNCSIDASGIANISGITRRSESHSAASSSGHEVPTSVLHAAELRASNHPLSASGDRSPRNRLEQFVKMLPGNEGKTHIASHSSSNSRTSSSDNNASSSSGGGAAAAGSTTKTSSGGTDGRRHGGHRSVAATEEFVFPSEQREYSESNATALPDVHRSELSPLPPPPPPPPPRKESGPPPRNKLAPLGLPPKRKEQPTQQQQQQQHQADKVHIEAEVPVAAHRDACTTDSNKVPSNNTTTTTSTTNATTLDATTLGPMSRKVSSYTNGDGRRTITSPDPVIPAVPMANAAARRTIQSGLISHSTMCLPAARIVQQQQQQQQYQPLALAAPASEVRRATTNRVSAATPSQVAKGSLTATTPPPQQQQLLPTPRLLIKTKSKRPAFTEAKSSQKEKKSLLATLMRNPFRSRTRVSVFDAGAEMTPQPLHTHQQGKPSPTFPPPLSAATLADCSPHSTTPVATPTVDPLSTPATATTEDTAKDPDGAKPVPKTAPRRSGLRLIIPEDNPQQPHNDAKVNDRAARKSAREAEGVNPSAVSAAGREGIRVAALSDSWSPSSRHPSRRESETRRVHISDSTVSPEFSPMSPLNLNESRDTENRLRSSGRDRLTSRTTTLPTLTAVSSVEFVNLSIFNPEQHEQNRKRYPQLMWKPGTEVLRVAPPKPVAQRTLVESAAASPPSSIHSPLFSTARSEFPHTSLVVVPTGGKTGNNAYSGGSAAPAQGATSPTAAAPLPPPSSWRLWYADFVQKHDTAITVCYSLKCHVITLLVLLVAATFLLCTILFCVHYWAAKEQRTAVIAILQESLAAAMTSLPPDFTLPPDVTIPPGFTVPPGFTTPPGFTLPAGYAKEDAHPVDRGLAEDAVAAYLANCSQGTAAHESRYVGALPKEEFTVMIGIICSFIVIVVFGGLASFTIYVNNFRRFGALTHFVRSSAKYLATMSRVPDSDVEIARESLFPARPRPSLHQSTWRQPSDLTGGVPEVPLVSGGQWLLEHSSDVIDLVVQTAKRLQYLRTFIPSAQVALMESAVWNALQPQSSRPSTVAPFSPMDPMMLLSHNTRSQHVSTDTSSPRASSFLSPTRQSQGAIRRRTRESLSQGFTPRESTVAQLTDDYSYDANPLQSARVSVNASQRRKENNGTDLVRSSSPTYFSAQGQEDCMAELQVASTNGSLSAATKGVDFNGTNNNSNSKNNYTRGVAGNGVDMLIPRTGASSPLIHFIPGKKHSTPLLHPANRSTVDKRKDMETHASATTGSPRSQPEEWVSAVDDYGSALSPLSSPSLYKGIAASAAGPTLASYGAVDGDEVDTLHGTMTMSLYRGNHRRRQLDNSGQSLSRGHGFAMESAAGGTWVEMNATMLASGIHCTHVYKKAAFLVCTLDFSEIHEGAVTHATAQNMFHVTQAMVSKAAAVAKQFGGVIYHMEMDSVFITFNALVPAAFYEVESCHAAQALANELSVLERRRWDVNMDVQWGICVNSGHCVAGSSFTQQTVVPIVVSDAITLAVRVSRLCNIIHCPVLVLESCYATALTKMAAIPVDIIGQDDTTSKLVFQLMNNTKEFRDEKSRYMQLHKGFLAMCKGMYDDAEEMLLPVLDLNRNAPRMLRLTRILREIKRKGDGALIPNPYYRRIPIWEFHEALANLEQLDDSIAALEHDMESMPTTSEDAQRIIRTSFVPGSLLRNAIKETIQRHQGLANMQDSSSENDHTEAPQQHDYTEKMESFMTTTSVPQNNNDTGDEKTPNMQFQTSMTSLSLYTVDGQTPRPLPNENVGFARCVTVNNEEAGPQLHHSDSGPVDTCQKTVSDLGNTNIFVSRTSAAASKSSLTLSTHVNDGESRNAAKENEKQRRALYPVPRAPYNSASNVFTEDDAAGAEHTMTDGNDDGDPTAENREGAGAGAPEEKHQEVSAKRSNKARGGISWRLSEPRRTPASESRTTVWEGDGFNDSATGNLQSAAINSQELETPELSAADFNEVSVRPARSFYQNASFGDLWEPAEESIGFGHITASTRTCSTTSKGMSNQALHERGGGGGDAANGVVGDRDNEFVLSGKMLGKGTFGTVYMGLHPDGSLVAIKEIPLHMSQLTSEDDDEGSANSGGGGNDDDNDSLNDGDAGDKVPALPRHPEGRRLTRHRHAHIPHAIELALKEIDTLSDLHNDNIVRYISSCFVNSKLYVIMEYVSGGSLLRMIEQFKWLPEVTVKRYTRDILYGLRYLHSRGIVHRDISPNNVLVSIDGTCKISDFGGSAMTVPPSDAAPDLSHQALPPLAPRQQSGKEKPTTTTTTTKGAAQRSDPPANPHEADESTRQKPVGPPASMLASPLTPSLSAMQEMASKSWVDALPVVMNNPMKPATQSEGGTNEQQQQHDVFSQDMQESLNSQNLVGSPSANEQAAKLANVFGTPRYMSPEACSGIVTTKSDIWAVGITMCQCISGRVPWSDADTEDIPQFISRVRSGELRPRVPYTYMSLQMAEFVDACLDPDPNRRPDIQELLLHPFLTN